MAATAAPTHVVPVAAGGEGERPLARADGVELLGEFEGSGFKEPPRLARRADGQIVRLTKLLHAVAAECDGRRDAEAVAAAVAARCGRGVSARNVRFLAESQLRPLGILALADGSNPAVAKRDPLLALRHRIPLVPERGVAILARPLAWTHHPAVQVVVLAALALFDFWLLGIHGLAAPLRATLYEPALLLGVLGAIVAATAFHELGHASACRYGGARPGVIGAGLYLVWPAFYCDVTDSYRLDRAGRLRTDLGGVYFNGIFALAMGAAYFATGQEPFLLVAFVQHVLVLQQLLPLLRFDGYYVLSDLTGVPDILSRIKPIFRSLVPWRKAEPAVRELKPWVRVVVTAYLLVLVPALVCVIAWIVLAAPRVLATVHDSLGLQLDRFREASGPAEIGVAAMRIAALCLPVGAMALSVGRSGRMAGRGLTRWSSGSIPRRLLVVGLGVATLSALGWFWWPNGEYQPIRPGERGTIGEAIGSVPAVGGGRPSFTPAEERAHAREATVREQATRAREHAPRSPAEPAPSAAPGEGETGPLGEEAPAWEDDATTPSEGVSGDPQATSPPSATPTPQPSAAPTASATPSPSTTAPTATPAPAAEAPTSTPMPSGATTGTATSTPTPMPASATPAPAATTTSTP